MEMLLWAKMFVLPSSMTQMSWRASSNNSSWKRDTCILIFCCYSIISEFEVKKTNQMKKMLATKNPSRCTRQELCNFLTFIKTQMWRPCVQRQFVLWTNWITMQSETFQGWFSDLISQCSLYIWEIYQIVHLQSSPSSISLPNSTLNK